MARASCNTDRARSCVMTAHASIAGLAHDGEGFVPQTAPSARSSCNREDNKIWGDDRRSSMPNPQLPPLLSPEPDREGSPPGPTSNSDGSRPRGHGNFEVARRNIEKTAAARRRSLKRGSNTNVNRTTLCHRR